jgi:deoxyribodipyrimidine photo-lyase
MPKTPVSLHWYRRDLRLTDNTALSHAREQSEQVIPVYILSTWKTHHDWTGPNRQEFLCGNLQSLARNLETIGSRLIVRSGAAVQELEKLIAETGAGAVYTNRDPDPFGKSVEKDLAALCDRLGVAFHTFKDAVLHESTEVLTGSGGPYRVYTPYSKNWLGLPKTAPLGKVRNLGAPPAASLKSLPLPSISLWQLTPEKANLPAPGEKAARERMKHFVEGAKLPRYADTRNFPAIAGTSTLSPDLRCGLISIRELYHRCGEALAATRDAAGRTGIQTYIKELAWREFYMAILHFYPEVLETDFNPELRTVAWHEDEAGFEAWKAGRTGFPIVDAGMRQLRATGWMHNRVRMIVSMFLTKDLHIHWMRGESYFMQQLVDGEIASNNGGWQWSAGTGADAAPWFRIQNPWTQTKNFDPEGKYIKQWVPELNDVSPEKFLAPPSGGLPLHRDYVLPILDHGTERARTLLRFKSATARG